MNNFFGNPLGMSRTFDRFMTGVLNVFCVLIVVGVFLLAVVGTVAVAFGLADVIG